MKGLAWLLLACLALPARAEPRTNLHPDIDETRAPVHLVAELHRALLQQSQPARVQRLTLHP